MSKRDKIEVSVQDQEGVGKMEVEIERYLSSPPQRPAPKGEQRKLSLS
jgi:hypothetical protein